jgi:transposase-like protein
MKKKRFTEQQIIGLEAEAGVSVTEFCRKHGFSDAAFYGWRGAMWYGIYPRSRRGSWHAVRHRITQMKRAPSPDVRQRRRRPVRTLHRKRYHRRCPASRRKRRPVRGNACVVVTFIEAAAMSVCALPATHVKVSDSP